jgi:hypothetical protein
MVLDFKMKSCRGQCTAMLNLTLALYARRETVGPSREGCRFGEKVYKVYFYPGIAPQIIHTADAVLGSREVIHQAFPVWIAERARLQDLGPFD